jgi:phosphopantetheine--protein transferase-like protein
MDKELLNEQPALGGEPGHDALAIGLDLESADNLPWLGDPSSESFYVEHFTSAEIAWCLCQPDHKLAFCGLWCAKEAAIKCDQGFAGLRRSEIEIVRDEANRPKLQSTRTPDLARASSYALSISYSGRMAVAVCLKEPLSAELRTRG